MNLTSPEFYLNQPMDPRSGWDLFKEKKVIVFGLPGAFTPTCSSKQLPGYEAMYDQFLEKGIDEIYCVSVNDGFVMRAWAKQHTDGFKVKCIADGNGEFTRKMGMLVDKTNLGFGMRSWRYAVVINNGIVEQMFAEEGIEDNHGEDPYVVSTPENVYEKL
jgi:peroxiredoxin